MQVETLAQQIERHDHALGVPPRPPVTPRRRPAGFARLGQLPEGEVGWMVLQLGAEDLTLTPADQHLVQRLVGEEAVVLDRADVHVDTVLGGIGPADLDQLADHGDHLVDVVGGVGDVGRRIDPDASHGLEPDGLAALRDLAGVAVLPLGPQDDLVVDVGDVRHQPHAEAGPLEVAAEDVIGQRGPAVTDVGRAVHGRSAQVDVHLARLTQGELADLAGGSVEQVEHEASVGAPCPATAAVFHPIGPCAGSGRVIMARRPPSPFRLRCNAPPDCRASCSMMARPSPVPPGRASGERQKRSLARRS